MVKKANNHDHFWIRNGILHESYKTIRGLRQRTIMKVEGFQDTRRCSDEEIEAINDKYVKECKHEFVSREYISQPYGTCVVCGAFVNS